MSVSILVATEIRELLSVPLDDFDVAWIATEEDTPAGAYAALVSLLSREVCAADMDALPDLEIVANVATGYDNVDLQAAAKRGIVVTNTPDVLTESTADLTLALILAVSRRLKEGIKIVESGEWKGWHPTQLLGLELQDCTVGIVGAGRIGRAVARRLAGFGPTILYTSLTPKPDLDRECGARAVSLYELLAASDVVSLHLPLDSGTRGMIGKEELAAMKPGSIIINTARGALIREEHLIAALASGRIGGAGLDVFQDEPLVRQELIDHPRVVMLPHIGSATTATRSAMANLAVKNVIEVLSGRPALTPVALTGG